MRKRRTFPMRRALMYGQNKWSYFMVPAAKTTLVTMMILNDLLVDRDTRHWVWGAAASSPFAFLWDAGPHGVFNVRIRVIDRRVYPEYM